MAIVIEVTDKVASSIQTKIEGIASAALAGAASIDRLNASLKTINGSSVAQLTASMNTLQASINQLNKSNATLAAQSTRAATALTNAGNSARKASRDIEGAADSTEKLGHHSAGVNRELLVLAHELSQGNYKQFAGSLLVLGEQVDFLGKVFTPLGLTITAAVLALGSFVALSVSAANETQHFAQALQGTNNYAGLTTDNLNAISRAVAEVTHSTVGSSVEIVTALTKTGQLQRQVIEQFAVSAQRLSRLSGESADDIVKVFAKAGEAPLKTAQELDNTLNFLSASQLNYIRTLEEGGDKAGAARALSQNLYDYLGNQAPQNVSTLSSSLHDLTAAISGYIDKLKELSNPQTKGALISSIQEQIDDLDRIAPNKNSPALQSRRQALVSQQDDLRQAQHLEEMGAAQQALNVQIQRAAKDADVAALSFGKYYNNVDQAKRQIALLDKTIADGLKSDKPSEQILDLQKHYGEIIANINKSVQGGSREAITAERERAQTIGRLTDELNKEVNAQGLVGDERERQIKLDQIDSQLKNRQFGRGLSTDESESFSRQITAAQNAARVNAAAQATYEQANGALIQYNATLAGAAIDLAKGSISQDQYTRAVNLATLAYNSASDPLLDYNKGLADQNELLQTFGPQTEIATRLQQGRNAAIAAGVGYNEQYYTQLFQAQSSLSRLQAGVNSLYGEGVGQLQSFVVQQQSLNVAYQAGYITIDQYNQKLIQLAGSFANFKLSTGQGDFSDVVTSNIVQVLEGYQNVLSSLKDSFGDFFVSLEDGFANSIGQAVVGAQSLRSALYEVAQGALSALIGSLVKLGIQYVINAALGESVAATTLAATTAASSAAAATTAAAWAPAAAAVNAATFGGGAAAGSVALTEIFALAQTLAAASSAGGNIGAGLTGSGHGGFAAGGYTGDMGTRDVAGVVHGQEYVMTAQATRRIGRQNLDSMNAGRGGSGGGVQIIINNLAPGVDIQARDNGSGQIEIIARKAAQDVVQQNVPGIVAGQIKDPNSTVSRSLNTHTTANRRR